MNIPKLSSKIFLIFLILLAASLAFSSSTFAQTGPTGGGCGTNIFDPNCNIRQTYQSSLQSDNGWSWMSSALASIVSFANRAVEGDAYFTPATGPGGLPFENRDPGLAGIIALGISGTYGSRNITPTDYLASINPFKPAYAIGTNFLSPVLEIWKIFRNIAYVFISVMLIVFGFLVMFRYRLDPRTVITISDALPKTIVALILITFSFAISGLFVDGSKLIESLINQSLKELGNNVLNKPGHLAFDRNQIVYNLDAAGNIIYPAPIRVLEIFGNFIGKFDLKGFKAGGGFISGLTTDIAKVVFNFMLISLMVQLLVSLLKYFATLFILTIFSPLVFLWAILPGQEETSQKWFMQMLTAALVFPAIYLMLNITYFLMIWVSDANGNAIVNHADFQSSTPVGFDVTTEMVRSLIIAGMLILTSKLPEAIEDALKAAPSGAVAHAGVDFKGAAKKVPFIGGFM